MTPCSVSQNIRNRSLEDAILASKVYLRFALFCSVAYGNYLRGSELCKRRGFAFWRCCSALLDHIICVFLGSAKKQMRRIDTRGIIAFGAIVTNEQAFWDRPIMKLVAKAVSAQDFGVVAHSTVSSAGSISRPQPTFIGRSLIHIRPKLFFEWEACTVPNGISSGMAFQKTELAFILFGDRGIFSTSALAFSVGHAQSMPCYPRGKIICQMPRHIGFAFRWLIVSSNVADRLTLDPPQPDEILRRYLGFLSTPAVAVAVGNILRGIIGVHKKSPFLCLIRRRVHARWPVLLWGCYRCNYTL